MNNLLCYIRFLVKYFILVQSQIMAFMAVNGADPDKIEGFVVFHCLFCLI